MPWNRLGIGEVKKLANRRAMICGISGQDGAYLARLLLEKGYEVIGTSRDAQSGKFINLRKLKIYERVTLCSMTMTDFRSTLQVLKHYDPDEIYNLAGQTSVGLSFEQPVETLESIAVGTLNLLECVRFLQTNTRIYNASSGECFGDTGENPASEITSFQPSSPYGVAKSTAHWLVSSYRKAYGIHASSGFLFNHESPLRLERFVTQKIVQAAYRISIGRQESLRLGNLDIERDWGWAPEYVEAMWLMLQRSQPEDFIIATGSSIKLREFVETVFDVFGLDWRRYVIVDEKLFRSADQLFSRANPSKAHSELNWRAQTMPLDVARRLAKSASEDGYFG